ncbi:MAG: hypothetical protein FJZ75_02470 [Bacteroidetes bacterium]|nr:hypothetical protein [Bacteroidota bacterium]
MGLIYLYLGKLTGDPIMKITVMGSAGETTVPAIFSQKHGHQRALELGDKDIRSRSALMVDSHLKIDFPADTFHQVVTQGLELQHLKYVFITRSSYPNFAAEELASVLPYIGERRSGEHLRIFGNQESIQKAKQVFQGIHPVSFHEIQPFQVLNLGPYVIHPLKASNNGDLNPFNYVVRKGRTSVLYATDTGLYDERNWRYLKSGSILDAVVLGCLHGARPSADMYRMGFPELKRFKEKTEELGISSPRTRWLMTQVSASDGFLHEEWSRLVEPFGFEVAYDGMQVMLNER